MLLTVRGSLPHPFHISTYLHKSETKIIVIPRHFTKYLKPLSNNSQLHSASNDKKLLYLSKNSKEIRESTFFHRNILTSTKDKASENRLFSVDNSFQGNHLKYTVCLLSFGNNDLNIFLVIF